MTEHRDRLLVTGDDEVGSLRRAAVRSFRYAMLPTVLSVLLPFIGLLQPKLRPEETWSFSVASLSALTILWTIAVGCQRGLRAERS